jgi:hypothetical protein
MWNWLHGMAVWPKSVKVVPQGFEVEVHSEDIFSKLLALNRKNLQGETTPSK